MEESAEANETARPAFHHGRSPEGTGHQNEGVTAGRAMSPGPLRLVPAAHDLLGGAPDGEVHMALPRSGPGQPVPGLPVRGGMGSAIGDVRGSSLPLRPRRRSGALQSGGTGDGRGIGPALSSEQKVTDVRCLKDLRTLPEKLAKDTAACTMGPSPPALPGSSRTPQFQVALSSQSIQEALRHVAGDDAPTAVRCGLGPAGGRLPGLSPILITLSAQADGRLDMVVPVIHASRHTATFIESPAPYCRSMHCGVNIRQGRRRPLQLRQFVTPLLFPLYIISPCFGLSPHHSRLGRWCKGRFCGGFRVQHAGLKRVFACLCIPVPGSQTAHR